MKTNGVQLQYAPSVRRAVLAKYLGDKFHLFHRQVDLLLEQTECGLSHRPFAAPKTRIVVIARGHGHYLLACRDAQPTHEATVVHHTDSRLLEFWGRMIEQCQRNSNTAPLTRFDSEPIRLVQPSYSRRKRKKVGPSRRRNRRFAAQRHHH